jgi:hypothetical protein
MNGDSDKTEYLSPAFYDMFGNPRYICTAASCGHCHCYDGAFNPIGHPPGTIGADGLFVS